MSFFFSLGVQNKSQPWMCQASPVRTHSDAPGDGQIILFISFGCCQCLLSTGWEIKFGCEGESQSSCLWSCQAQARQAANNLFDLKISFILLFGRGALELPISPSHGGTGVNHPARRIQLWTFWFCINWGFQGRDYSVWAQNWGDLWIWNAIKLKF